MDCNRPTDLQYRDYSFMAGASARAGFDVFTMSFTVMGLSPRPLMDDPGNVDAEFQPLLVPHVLSASAPLAALRSSWYRAVELSGTSWKP